MSATKPFRPMLAETIKDIETLKYPVFASPKLDGIRCLGMHGVPTTRSMKPVRNKFVQQFFYDNREVLEGLDGELIVGDPTAPDVYRKTSSGVNSADGEPDFTYYVFDVWDVPGMLFYDRKRCVDNVHNTIPRVKAVLQNYISCTSELLTYEAMRLADGYEGVMVRSIDGLYKQGCSTIKEGALLKLKRFEDAEAIVIGFEEQMHNENELTRDERGYAKRSSHKANQTSTDSLGALVVRGLTAFEGVEFKIGTGFDKGEWVEIWRDRQTHEGSIVKFKHFSIGVKDKPRFPKFVGFRDKSDMGGE